MKKRSLKKRMKSWFFEKFLQRYLVSVDKVFIELFIKYDEKAKTKTLVENRTTIEYGRIMKMLNSEKYKDFFYKVVDYDRHTAESLIKPYTNTLKDKIFSFIAQAYVYLFKRDLYKSIQQFKRIRDGVISLDKKVNEYMTNTTLNERLDKATALGIINGKSRTAQKRLRNMQAIGIDNIIKRNKE
jgi:hypothetical protein